MTKLEELAQKVADLHWEGRDVIVGLDWVGLDQAITQLRIHLIAEKAARKQELIKSLKEMVHHAKNLIDGLENDNELNLGHDEAALLNVIRRVYGEYFKE